jgi:hypothetical protein
VVPRGPNDPLLQPIAHRAAPSDVLQLCNMHVPQVSRATRLATPDVAAIAGGLAESITDEQLRLTAGRGVPPTRQDPDGARGASCGLPGGATRNHRC